MGLRERLSPSEDTSPGNGLKPSLVTEPDLIACGSQAHSPLDPAAMELGEDIYRRIVDEGDEAELHKLQRLAALSVQGVRPQIVEAENPSR
jgi:hypothetical protein